MEAVALEKTDAILEKWRPKKGNLIMILHEVDAYFRLRRALADARAKGAVEGVDTEKSVDEGEEDVGGSYEEESFENGADLKEKA